MSRTALLKRMNSVSKSLVERVSFSSSHVLTFMFHISFLSGALINAMPPDIVEEVLVALVEKYLQKTTKDMIKEDIKARGIHDADNVSFIYMFTSHAQAYQY